MTYGHPEKFAASYFFSSIYFGNIQQMVITKLLLLEKMFISTPKWLSLTIQTEIKGNLFRQASMLNRNI